MHDEIEWLNTRDLYIQFTHNFPKLGLQLLEENSFIFDDKYFYWIPAKKGRKPIYQGIVKKAPIWMYPKKMMPAEKAKNKTLPQGQQILILNSET